MGLSQRGRCSEGFGAALRGPQLKLLEASAQVIVGRRQVGEHDGAKCAVVIGVLMSASSSLHFISLVLTLHMAGHCFVQCTSTCVANWRCVYSTVGPGGAQ